MQQNPEGKPILCFPQVPHPTLKSTQGFLCFGFKSHDIVKVIKSKEILYLEDGVFRIGTVSFILLFSRCKPLICRIEGSYIIIYFFDSFLWG